MKRWNELIRFANGCDLSISDNCVGKQIRPIGHERQNRTFAGRLSVGKCAATFARHAPSGQTCYRWASR